MKLLLLWGNVIVMINCQQDIVSYNSVCNINKSDFVNHSYDYRPNWTSLSPITIINYKYLPTE